MDPYKTLRVPKNASAARITKAFRRRALDTHPDRGGDQQTFQDVQLAYKVLSDAARRAKYDTTGTIDPDAPDNDQAFALTIVSSTYLAVMQALVAASLDPKEDPRRH